MIRTRIEPYGTDMAFKATLDNCSCQWLDHKFDNFFLSIEIALRFGNDEFNTNHFRGDFS